MNICLVKLFLKTEISFTEHIQFLSFSIMYNKRNFTVKFPWKQVQETIEDMFSIPKTYKKYHFIFLNEFENQHFQTNIRHILTLLSTFPSKLCVMLDWNSFHF